MADERKCQVLEAALTAFARHGYRKTSMEDVAQAAGISRQGLYLYFPTKEDLFRAMVRHVIKGAHAAVEAELATSTALEDRLVNAFDAWVGRFVEERGSDVDDLMQACRTLLGSLVDDENAHFAARIAQAIAESDMGSRYAHLGLSSAELAGNLCATAEGLKSLSETRRGFVIGMRRAVRALCVPFAAVS